MKTKVLILLSILFSGFVFISCSDNDNDDKYPNLDPTESDNIYTNKWIYIQMKKLYLWCDNLPQVDNFDTDPEVFFKSLLYKRQEIDGDRFSSMHEDKTKSKASSNNNNLGFNIILKNYYDSQVKVNVLQFGFLVTNVRKDSDAQKKGLKRGHIIYAINKTSITVDNCLLLYNMLLSANSVSLSVYNEYGDRIEINDIKGSNYDKDDPIWFTSVIDTAGIKVGYIVYNQFEKGDEYKYDKKFAETIDKMVNQQGVKDVVLDLRYNSGGYLISSTYMASALVPNRDVKKIYQYLAYNSTKHKALSKKYGDAYLFEDQINGGTAIPRTNLNNLCILATENTASASEALINGLRPYMAGKLTHIGTTTVGKDKGSWPLKSDNSKVKWTYNPLIFRVLNSEGNQPTGDYIHGLNPDIKIDEWEEGYPLIETINGFLIPNLSDKSKLKGGLVTLGDPSEPLLSEAIAKITGIKRKKKSVKSVTYNIVPVEALKIKQLDPPRMIADPQDLKKEQ